MKTTVLITSTALALGTVALAAGPALAAPATGGVLSVTSAKDASAPIHPRTTTPTTPTTPSSNSTNGTVPSGAPDTGTAAGDGSSVLPLTVAGVGVLGSGTVLGIWWARHHQGTGK